MALAACLTGVAARATAQSSGAGPATFARELERLANRIEITGAAQLPDLVVSIPPAWTVHAGGETITVSSAWITRALEESRKNPAAWPKQRATLVARLKAAEAEVVTLASAGPAPDLERSRRVAADILARDEFRRNAAESALAKLQRRIADWFVALWDRMGGSRLGTGKATTVLAWVVAFAALSGLVWWLLSRVLGPSGRSGLALTAPAPRRRSARAWARDAAASPDPREAVRCAYRAAVVSLEDEGAWRPDAARTPREHLRLLPSEHRRRTLFADVARRFEEIWFGARTATADDTRTVLARLVELGCLHGE